VGSGGRAAEASIAKGEWSLTYTEPCAFIEWYFTWVKAHNGNYGNEIADHLAKEAACGSDVDIAYIKIP